MLISTPKCNSSKGLSVQTQMRVFKGACEYFLKQGIDAFEAERFGQAVLRQLRRGQRVRKGDHEATADCLLSKANLEYVRYATGEVL